MSSRSRAGASVEARLGTARLARPDPRPGLIYLYKLACVFGGPVCAKRRSAQVWFVRMLTPALPLVLVFGGSYLSNAATCLTHVFFKSDE